MKRLIYFFAFSSLAAGLPDQADEFFNATLFSEAVPLYEELLATPGNEEEHRQWRLRLGQAYYALGRYDDTIQLLKSEEEAQSHYFLGLSFKHKEQYQTALDYFSFQNLSSYKPALIEKGNCEALLGKTAEAEKTFRLLLNQEPACHLQLAKIFLSRSDVDQAEKQLALFAPATHTQDFYEWNYLLGVSAFLKEKYADAIPFLQLAQQGLLPATDSLYHYLGWSFLKLNQNEKAREVFQLLSIPQRYFALSATYMNEPGKVDTLLSATSFYNHSEALLLRAKAASTYQDKESLLSQLMESHPSSPLLAEGWFLRGLNAFEEGKATGQPQLFEQAALNFYKAAEIFSELDPLTAIEAQKYEALAWLHHPSGENSGKNLMMALISKKGQDSSLLFLLGAFYQWKRDFERAESTLASLAESYPDAPEAAEALFRAARSAEKNQKPKEVSRKYKQLVYENYPSSSFAPEAYFSLYSYQEYMQGGRASMKHLQAFPALFPQSPLILNVLYIIGLDERKDRKSTEGRWVRKRNLTEAITVFHEIETRHEALLKKGFIPKEDQNYYQQLRDRAILERALTNLAIAEEATGAKKQIFIDYSKEVLEDLVKQLETNAGSDALSTSYEEALYWQALVYVKDFQDEKAEATLDKLLAKYQTLLIGQGYYLSRAWYEKGILAMRQNNYQNALELLSRAEVCAKGKTLTADQTLDLWIQQSACYRNLHKLDQAMLILSKVINENVISSLRVKAMFLRAELYELEGRRELARRQLEAVAQKGGDWAVKAKEKLDNEYYHE